MAVGEPSPAWSDDGADERAANVASAGDAIGVPPWPPVRAAPVASGLTPAASVTRITWAKPTSGEVGAESAESPDCSTEFSR